MGNSSSKVDANTIEKIESDAFELIVRIKEEELKIHHHLKCQISRALFFYCKQIKHGEINKCISKEKAKFMKNLIHQAQDKTELLKTHAAGGNYHTRGKNLNEIRNWVADIEKNLMSGGIPNPKLRYFLEVATECSLVLMRNPRVYLKETEKNNLSVLLLKLYLKTPQTKTSDLIKRNLKDLQHINVQFKLLKLEYVTGFNLQEVQNEIENLDSEIYDLNQNKKRIMRFVRKYTKTDAQCSLKELKQVSDDVDEYTEFVNTLCPPVGQETIAKVSLKIDELQEYLSEDVFHESEPISTELEQRLFKKYKTLKEALVNIEEITETLKVIKDIDDKMFLLMESNTKFEEKMKLLWSYREVLFDIDSTNSKVSAENTAIIKRIEGFQTLETANYLRQMYKTLVHYQMYAEQFAFPMEMEIYASKQREISSLLDSLTNLSKTNFFVQGRVRILEQMVKKASETLQKKAANNGSIFATLDLLETIKTKMIQITTTANSSLAYLTEFNNIRQELSNVKVLHSRISSKKTEIFNQLHNFENKIYSQEVPEFVQKYKNDLDECETNECLEETYEKIHAISSWWDKIGLPLLSNNRFVSVLYDTIRIVLESLQNSEKEYRHLNSNAEKLDKIEQKAKDLRESSLSLTKQRELLENYKITLEEIKITSIQTETLDKIMKIERWINVETAKIDLKTESYEILQRLKEEIKKLTHPIDTDAFATNINHIFLLRDSIEDMLEGDKELDVQKHDFLQQIYKILQHLDNGVAKFASTRKPTANILELQNHFQNINLNDLKISRNTTEFVQLVRKRAESFEANVKYYLGTGSSVDFYVIHENLIRLLEQLDCVVCENDNELLTQTVEAIEYTKRLIKELNRNAIAK